jgi:hypothetical protein
VSEPLTHGYGTKVTFQKGRVIQFPTSRFYTWAIIAILPGNTRAVSWFTTSRPQPHRSMSPCRGALALGTLARRVSPSPANDSGWSCRSPIHWVGSNLPSLSSHSRVPRAESPRGCYVAELRATAQEGSHQYGPGKRPAVRRARMTGQHKAPQPGQFGIRLVGVLPAHGCGSVDAMTLASPVCALPYIGIRASSVYVAL